MNKKNSEVDCFTYDVFLSHNSRDKDSIKRLKVLLEQRKLRCWYDEDELRPGMPWQELLENGIKSSKSVVVAIGETGLGPWENEEMQAALRLAVKDKRAVIPVLLPETEAEPELPMFLSNRTYIDCREGYKDEDLALLEWGITGLRPGGINKMIQGDSKTALTPQVAATTEGANEMLQFHLLMSGGGFRATLFHLGILRFMAEHRLKDSQSNLLASVNLVAGVSGGSITASHFVAHRNKYLRSFDDAAKPLIEFVKTTDVRREVLTKHKRVSEILRQSEILPKKFLLSEIPEECQLVILGTSLVTGNCIAFKRIGIQRWIHNDRSTKLHSGVTAAANQLGLEKAIEASAAFPPFFPPFTVSANEFEGVIHERDLADIRLEQIGDGGIRDNLALEWYTSEHGASDNVHLLVSDAGANFDWTPENISYKQQSPTTWLARLQRTVDIQMNRLSILDSALMPSKNSSIISINAWRNLSDLYNSDMSLWSQPLPRAVASYAASTPTDLIPASQSEIYAIIRLAYDLSASKLAEFDLVSENVEDNFWENVWPSGVSTFGDANAKSSLEFHLRTERKRQFASFWDIWKHIPITRKQRRLAWLSALGLVFFALVGGCQCLKMVGNFAFSVLPNNNRISYQDLLEFQETSGDWETIFSDEVGTMVTGLRAEYTRREGARAFALVDQLKLQVVFDIPAEHNQIFSGKAEPAPVFFVLSGRVVNVNGPALVLEDVNISNPQLVRPDSWQPTQ